MVSLLTISFGFALIIFVALPYGLTLLTGVREETQPIMFNIIDAVVKILIFLIYLLAISQLKDIQRLFQYHGAEHKAVHCYEHKKALLPRHVKPYSPIHPRCGTSFLLWVILMSIVVFALLPAVVLWLWPSFPTLGFWTRRGILFPLRILLIPVIAGLAYEVLKLSGKHQDNWLMHNLAKPGLWFQKITTAEPDKKQIEVAIASLKLLLQKEGHSSSS